MFRAVKAKIPEYLKKGAIVIDVRSPEEFVSGHFEGSLNIPLQHLATQVGDLDKNKTVLLCCKSGIRSGMAVAVLKNLGFKEVVNAGPWNNLL